MLKLGVILTSWNKKKYLYLIENMIDNEWVKALVEYNKNKKKWSVPKRGTKEYQKLKKIYDKLKKK